MLENIVNLILLTGFILAILNIIKSVFQLLPIFKQGLTYELTNQEVFLIGLSIAYMIAFIIKGFGI